MSSFQISLISRCEEHLYKRLRRSVRPSVCPHDVITWKREYVETRLFREEEEETDYVAVPLCRDSFAPRD
jgi:hypothetical protein